jgi:hypothetical protein
VNGSDINCGLLIEIWQYRWQPLRQHGLAHPGWPEEGEVVPARGGDFESEPAMDMTAQIFHVNDRRRSGDIFCIRYGIRAGFTSQHRH